MALFLTKHGLTLGWHQPLNRGSESQGSADVCMVGAKPHALCPLPNLGQGTSLASVLSSAPSLWPAVRDAHRELVHAGALMGSRFIPLRLNNTMTMGHREDPRTCLWSGH